MNYQASNELDISLILGFSHKSADHIFFRNVKVENHIPKAWLRKRRVQLLWPASCSDPSQTGIGRKFRTTVGHPNPPGFMDIFSDFTHFIFHLTLTVGGNRH
ncbi:hypothetical protein GOODEAATRI_027762 [Goodea atripinnis]|uniref:Uncharacterized protein n=1 Tax=Goodea atripinnis TaxID=208336 RepID=A0ABV0NNR3_9TELE